MGDRAAGGRLGDAGFVSVEFLACVFLAMVVLVAIANVIVFEYGQSVVRTAVDQGVREGARAGTNQSAACQSAANQVLDDLLGGPTGALGGGVSITCTTSSSGTVLDATAQGRFVPWLRPQPDFRFTARASAVVEPAG